MTTHDAAQLPEAFMAAFNAGDTQLLEQLYSDPGVLVPRPGHPVTGTDRAAANQYLLGFGLPIDARLRHAYVAGDTALLIVDWTIRGRARDGREIDLHGTATDVARQGSDGLWRYLIDNPFGAD
ncbi:nuclear transport factor 2 family protein [Nonomuraea sp. NPDC026600]|uniref:YybH family protein n=1 Tax=Nonomuraea sp. NPDC026600 TaxID=3155363 RepID=UPI0033FA0455